jgi:hypothetical protein
MTSHANRVSHQRTTMIRKGIIIPSRRGSVNTFCGLCQQVAG